MKVTFRPIDAWPGALRRWDQRTGSPFTAGWQSTLDLLDRELRALNAAHIVVQLALREDDIRLDGMPRGNAREPDHPGAIIAFDSKHGPLKYATDIYSGYQGRPGWQANVRAIALGLEALRKVDRYGITKRGEQYTGWRELPSGIAMPAATAMSLEDAAQFVATHAGDPNWADDLLDSLGTPLDLLPGLYRDAAKALHPDGGGDPELFKRLGEARRILEAHT